MKIAKFVLGFILINLFCGFSIFLAEGMKGFLPFINLEAIFIMWGGVFIVTLMSFSEKEIRTSFRCALTNYNGTEAEYVTANNLFNSLANSSVSFGLIATILGMILLLSGVDDVAMVPKRLAMALTALFYGFLMSEVIFVPLKNNINKKLSELKIYPKNERGRILTGALGLFVILTCFFVMMYALSSDFTSTMHHEDRAKMVKEGLKITIREQHKVPFFASGSAELIPAMKVYIDKIATVLKAPGNNILIVEGHTDNVPIATTQFASNWELSTARATNVVKYLIQKHGFPPEKITAIGYGENKPIVPNDTDENRARNRRIELFIKLQK